MGIARVEYWPGDQDMVLPTITEAARFSIDALRDDVCCAAPTTPMPVSRSRGTHANE
jgi:hypothetical protein